MYTLTVPEAGSPKLKGWQVQAPTKTWMGESFLSSFGF